MKQFLAVIGAIFLSTTAFAGEFEFELIRTPEVPGFFMVQVFPTSDAEPIAAETIFVENFSEADAPQYKSIEPLLLESGATVVSRDQLAQFSLQPNATIAVLGNQIGDLPTLQLTPDDDALDTFETFQTEHLQPIFLRNLVAEFGGNISDVVVDTSEFSGEYPAVIVGKFQQPMRTRMHLTGDSAFGQLELSSPLPLDDETLSEHPLAAHLPGLWEKMSAPAADESSSTDWTLAMINWFPVIVAFAGILILVAWFFRARARYRRDLDDNEFHDEAPLHNAHHPAPTTPQSPPFELISHPRDQELG